MILALGIGWALQAFAGLDEALPFAVVIGFLVALVVPTAAACPVPRRSAPGDLPPGGR